MVEVYECGNEPSGSTGRIKFVDYLRISLVLSKHSAPWSLVSI